MAQARADSQLQITQEDLFQWEKKLLCGAYFHPGGAVYPQKRLYGHSVTQKSFIILLHNYRGKKINV